MIVPVLLHLGSIIALGQNQRVSLHYNQAEVRTVLDDIEKQTGLIFSYSSRLVDDQTSVDISASRITIDSAMAVIFPDVPVRAVFMEQQIILKRERKKTESGIRVEISKPDFHPFTVSGYVRDVATGEVLIGATVSVTGISVGTISNKYGFFSLTLDQPVDSLICTYVGYAKQVQSLTRNNQVINFQLKEHLQSIVEVVIYSDEKLDEIRTTRSSEQKIRPEAVRKMPALFGEKDVIKSLAAIPGIKFYGDGSTIFYVRGGSRDQNYVTIDEAPVYNPMHLLGFLHRGSRCRERYPGLQGRLPGQLRGKAILPGGYTHQGREYAAVRHGCQFRTDLLTAFHRGAHLERPDLVLYLGA